MHLSWHALTLLPLCIIGALADFLGSTYPAPTDVTSDESLIAAGWKNFTSLFEIYLKEGHTPAFGSLSGVGNVTFSVGLFSVHDASAAELQYHHTSPEIVNAPQGTTKPSSSQYLQVCLS